MEEQIRVPSDSITLAGLFDRGVTPDSENGVVVTHPHPLYGGDMYNPVVETIVQTYHAKGWATLRFNFRGVGTSGGHYDDGVGEQDDVVAAVDYMRQAGIKRIDLAGYSFGAWVCAQCASALDTINCMIMVSPPVAMMGFAGVGAIPRLAMVVTGSEDEIAPPEMIQKHLATWNPETRFAVIDGADHFFMGWQRVLQQSLESVV
ncbi:MAG: alpha/beta fold hydrolase [Thermodesulfobacteriota bacterium]|nr:alpha/beta fold hydrolase [Thermodesulfobacteriota bacterium]